MFQGFMALGEFVRVMMLCFLLSFRCVMKLKIVSSHGPVLLGVLANQKFRASRRASQCTPHCLKS